ncbi:helix-turn-helix domain-containing protein [Rhodococcus opacus]|uniref:helix-turn-helix domain-containing protein n=1 Tax=Rhodococcus opacus TaxID=37919 RepID=UPI001C43FEE6|nr:helix-turn-helix domain-containing protein [Rhodococcus opacus]MBV6758366.1 helix-turn-helix domain-containing protein [Rhodococcus opacus]
MPGKSKTGPEAIERRDLQDEALRLRRQGWSYAKIGDQLGKDRSTVNRYVQDALREITKDGAEDVLNTMVSRFDEILEGHYLLAAAGDKDAAGVVLKIEDRRARLFGLYQLAEQRIKSEGRELSAVDAFHAAMLGEKASEDDLE